LDIEQRERVAKRILGEPLFQEAWTTIHEEFLDRWENSQTQDTQAREHYWLGLQLLKKLKTHFESVMTTGELSRGNKPIF
jgi:hypothetical protein